MVVAIDRIRDVMPPPMSEQDMEMARAAQRCIVEALDRSRAAAIMLTYGIWAFWAIM